MKSQPVIDYAMPCMMAEKALKDLHNAVLDQKLDEAIEHCMETIDRKSTRLNSSHLGSRMPSSA